MNQATEQTDVLVVGAGAAGMTAALHAHELGASVILIEKSDEATAGGNTRVSGGAWFINKDQAASARYLRSLSSPFGVPDDVVSTWSRETIANSAWMQLLGANVTRNNTNDVLPEFPEFDGSECFGGLAAIRGIVGDFALYDFMMDALRQRGVGVRFNARAVSLIRGEGGQVDGAVVLGGDGRQRSIGARGGVVLATGGFEANESMVRSFLRLADVPRWGSPACTGDGLLLAQSAGADLWHMHNMMTITGFQPPDRDIAGLYLSLWAAQNYIFVGRDGRRMIDESALPRHGHVFARGTYLHFPVREMFVVFDENMRCAGPLSAPRDTLAVGWSVLMQGYRWSADNSAEIGKEWIVKADSIGELAARIGVSDEVLSRTVDDYNRACGDGFDAAFGRSPGTLKSVSKAPFYAIKCSPLLGWSNGGPRHDGRARVLDVRGKPVAGLYAAGAVSSSYAWCKDGGFHIADALAFGRVAAADAVARAGAVRVGG